MQVFIKDKSLYVTKPEALWPVHFNVNGPLYFKRWKVENVWMKQKKADSVFLPETHAQATGISLIIIFKGDFFDLRYNKTQRRRPTYYREGYLGGGMCL